MQQVNLTNLPYFKDSQRLNRLNEHFMLHDEFMAHQVSVATGCDYRDALKILFIVQVSGAGKLFLAVYHTTHPNFPVFYQDIYLPFPSLPWRCSDCDLLIEDHDKLLYDVALRINSSIEFEYKL